MASILIVDPSKSNRLYLRLTLEKQGYQVFEAGNGLEALESYEHHRPNLVITEIKLPVLSGADLVQRIKLLAKETFAPVFVVTNAFKPDSIQRILSVGADDFLQKPYPEELLLAKIASLLRNVNFYDDLKQSKEMVSSLHMSLALEHKSAERIFEKFVHGPRQEVPGLEAHVSPASIFNGDVFLSTITPAGNVITLLGDFTGHGLPAAIGAIPVAEVFYSMVKKGRTLKEIIFVINDKLKTILPAHIFFSCVAVKVFPKRRSVSLFNAGMQPVVMLDEASGEYALFESSSVPLGVLDSFELDVDFTKVDVTGSEHFICYTDGIVEAMDDGKEIFGVPRLVESLQTSRYDIGRLVDAAQDFCHGCVFNDDVSIIKLSLADILMQPNQMIASAVLERIPPPSDWSLNYVFSAANLRCNPHPIESIVDAIIGMQPITPYKEDIFIILSELYNNALEHGILQLDSCIKQQSNGFLAFAEAKQKALETLSEGRLMVDIQHEALSDSKGRLRILVSHDGPGRALDVTTQTSSEIFSGRGITIVRFLCSDFQFDDGGARVEAVYEWERRDGGR